jgi:hypothetical protein
VAAPALTGFAIDKTGQFFWAFAISAGVTPIGAGAYLFGLGRVEPVDWRDGARTLPMRTT